MDQDFLAPLEKLPCFMRVAIGEEEYCDVGDMWEDPPVRIRSSDGAVLFNSIQCL